MYSATFEKLIKEYAPSVYRVALARTGDAELAQDVAQQTFLMLLEKEPKFSYKEQLKVWLIRTACKLAASELRRFDNSRTVPLDGIAAPSINDELTFELTDLLSRLPETMREVTVMFYIEDMSIRDIAKAMELTPATVKTRLSRARKAIEKVYKEELL